MYTDVAPPPGSPDTEPRPLGGVCHELPSIHQGPPLKGTGVPQGTQHQDHGVTHQVRGGGCCVCGGGGGEEVFGNTVCTYVRTYFPSDSLRHWSTHIHLAECATTSSLMHQIRSGLSGSGARDCHHRGWLASYVVIHYHHAPLADGRMKSWF